MIDEKLIDENYRLPQEYKGDFACDNSSMKTTPRKWTDMEHHVIDILINKGLNSSQIMLCLDRSIESINNKIRRRKKINCIYNDSHRDEKYEYNNKFIKYIKPESVLDVYAGMNSYYNNRGIKNIISNDEKEHFNTDFHMKSHKLVEMLYLRGDKYDLVDLDPFGSAYDCFEYSIKMSQKGIIITLGELGHKRFKRIDYVNKKYGIKKYNDFNTQTLIKHIINIGKDLGKKLIPIYICDWNNIARVYFEIKN